MRVTDSSLYKAIQQRILAARQNFESASTSVTTGKKINALKDDPLVLQHTLRHDRQEADLGQYKSTLGRQLDINRTYETKVEEVYQILSTIQSTMVQLANPHQTEDTRNVLTAELRQMREHLLAVANTQVDGRYIFSGGRTDTPAFAQDGSYQGDNLELMVEILPGVSMEANMTGGALFAGEGIPNGVNVFAMIDSLLDAVATGDPQSAIQSRLNDVERLIQQSSHVRTHVGVRLNRVELAQNTLAQLELSLAQKRQNFEDVDYVTALTEFKAAEYRLEATMQTSGNLIKPSLLNYLR